jgi:hypothetical protein
MNTSRSLSAGCASQGTLNSSAGADYQKIILKK